MRDGPLTWAMPRHPIIRDAPDCVRGSGVTCAYWGMAEGQLSLFLHLSYLIPRFHFVGEW